MAELLSDITYWHWLVFGVLLIAVETLIPGAFFMWPGLAAILVGLGIVAFPALPWTAALSIWAVLSVITVTGWVYYRRKHPAAPAANTTLNRRGTGYISQIYTLDRPVINGNGAMRVDDTVWKIVCNQDVAAGSQVRVTGVEGTSLRVEKA